MSGAMLISTGLYGDTDIFLGWIWYIIKIKPDWRICSWQPGPSPWQLVLKQSYYKTLNEIWQLMMNGWEYKLNF